MGTDRCPEGVGMKNSNNTLFSLKHFKHIYRMGSIDESDAGGWCDCLDNALCLLEKQYKESNFKQLGEVASKLGEIEDWVKYTKNKYREVGIYLLPYPSDYRMEYVYIIKVDHGGCMYLFSDCELHYANISEVTGE